MFQKFVLLLSGDILQIVCFVAQHIKKPKVHKPLMIII